jgi:broad specificity phosphatase PhoE
MKHLYFIRHGESQLNVQHIFAGHIDTPLTDLGRSQARTAAGQARALSCDVIVSSPLSRALETAQIVAHGIGYPVEDIITNDIFKERSFGKLAGLSWDDYDESADAENGVETDAELLERARRGLEFLQNLPGETVLLVGHGSFSGALRTAIDPSQKYREPGNAQLIQLI